MISGRALLERGGAIGHESVVAADGEYIVRLCTDIALELGSGRGEDAAAAVGVGQT